MINIDRSLPIEQVNQILEHFQAQGVLNYSIIPGNGCVWASYRNNNAYFTFDNDNKLVEIIVD